MGENPGSLRSFAATMEVPESKVGGLYSQRLDEYRRALAAEHGISLADLHMIPEPIAKAAQTAITCSLPPDHLFPINEV